ncbi:MAG TPA: hypothetical protein VNO53_04215 [Steroidobacteraceae bacterium]|nr:hypothetical protein [Steroidobacteraceae bacterium]
MTSFAVTIEPAPQPRLAVLALVVHLAAAASPWVAHVAYGPAVLMSLLALIGLASTLAAVPGRHHRLAELVLDGEGCRARIRSGGTWEPAEIGPRSRALAGLVFLDIRAGGRRLAWLLPRDAVQAGAFRSLKARVRLTC